MIMIGTCSWADKSTIKSNEFYPSYVSTPQERLKYYARHFSTLEVDSTYYAIAPQRNTLHWAERTPPDFVFHIKVYSALTGHGVDVRTLPRDLKDFIKDDEKSKRYVYIKDRHMLNSISERFLDSLEPLVQAQKLGVLVFQYPPWFHYSFKNMDYILFCQKIVQGLSVGVEFRHGSWLIPQRRNEVLNFLKSNDLIYITADEPQYGSLSTIPFVPANTTETAYFRLHGRNKDMWFKKGIETSLRYKYLYSDKELEELVPPVNQISQKVKNTYIMFNNCHGGFAMKNALSMMELICAD